MEIVEIENKWKWGYSIQLICDGVGVLEIQFENGYEWGYITNLAVHPSKQRKGIATRLIQRAEEIIKEQGYDEAQLWVEQEREWTYEWYKRLGYKTIITQDGFYKMRKIFKEDLILNKKEK